MLPLLLTPFHETTHYIFWDLRSETVRKLLRSENTVFVTSRQPLALLISGGRGSARVLGTSMVQYIEVLVPFISVCHGTDYSLFSLIARGTGLYWTEE